MRQLRLPTRTNKTKVVIAFLMLVASELFLVTSPAPRASAEIQWNRYTNGRFGYAVAFPATWESIAPADGSDGRVFQSSKGDTARVWGGLEDAEPKGMVGARVTSRKKLSDGWIQTGTAKKGKQIVYARMRRKGGAFAVLQISYPSSRKQDMAVVVSEMSARFESPCTAQAANCE